MRHAVDARPIERASLIRTAVRAWTLRTMVGYAQGFAAWPWAFRLNRRGPTRPGARLCSVWPIRPGGRRWTNAWHRSQRISGAFGASSGRRYVMESGATFSFATRVIGTTKSDFGIEIPITETVLVMHHPDGTTEEFGGF